MMALKVLVTITVAWIAAYLQGCGSKSDPTPAPTPPPTPKPKAPTPVPPAPPTPAPSGTCKIGDHVKCPDETPCAGNECCPDQSTCPSADNSYHRCLKPKAVDCTSGGTPSPTKHTPAPPAPPTPPPGNGSCKVGDHVRCSDGTKCAGNECCRDSTTCPSASPSYAKCPKPKKSDCVNGPPPPTHCTSAECCKKKAEAGDFALCDDFFNAENGIAFTMLSTETWEGKGSGAHGLDNGVFNKEPPTKRLDDAQQAMSLTHHEKSASPYPGYRNAYGIALPMGPPSTFWKYFQQLTPGDGKLCALCTDGQNCCPKCRRPLGTMTYDEFQKQKNAVMAATGTDQCSNHVRTQYNEFDTNGLSSNDLAGIFYNERFRSGPTISDHDLCNFMAKSKQSRTKWPFYIYAFDEARGTSSLYLDHYIDCGSTLSVAI